MSIRWIAGFVLLCLLTGCPRQSRLVVPAENWECLHDCERTEGLCRNVLTNASDCERIAYACLKQCPMARVQEGRCKDRPQSTSTGRCMDIRSE